MHNTNGTNDTKDTKGTKDTKAFPLELPQRLTFDRPVKSRRNTAQGCLRVLRTLGVLRV